MATTEQILSEAKNLGKLIKEHPATVKMEKAIDALQDDTDAQHIMNDYNRLTMQIAEKEQSGQPIEVDEKHKVNDLHKQVVMNKVLQDLQMAQMDYSDLMRQIDAAMTGEIAPEPPAEQSPPQTDTPGSTPGDSPIIQ